MSEIMLSSAVRQNLLSLQNTAALMGRTQERLATGKKVNSALDNPTNFFTAASLNSRGGDLTRLLDSVGNAMQTLRAADEGIKAITKLVETAQATGRQALQASGPQVTQAQVTGENSGVDLNDGEALLLGATEVATFTLGGQIFNADDESTVDDLLAFINGLENYSASIVDDELQITASNDESIEIAIGGANAAVLEAAIGIDDETEADPVTTPNATRASLESQFNQLLDQINQLAADASYNGVNLLDGDDLQVIFNEDGSSSLTINGVDFSASGLALSAASEDAFQENGQIEGVLDDLSKAISTLRTQAAQFGSNLSVVETRQNFTKGLVNVLETGAANLVLADTNEEGANMLALQTRQQLSSVALSLASQADQNVLRLF